MRIIVAQTAASGAIYTRELLAALLRSEEVEQIAFIESAHTAEVSRYERVTLPEDPRIVRYAAGDLFAPPASGSARYEAMAVIPCSAGTLGRIAAGVSQTLLERAADVQLKERRRLVLVLRETPLSLIHLRNAATVTEAGAVVLPACPSFYAHPATIEELVRSVVERTVEQLGVRLPHYEWGGDPEK